MANSSKVTKTFAGLYDDEPNTHTSPYLQHRPQATTSQQAPTSEMPARSTVPMLSNVVATVVQSPTPLPPAEPSIAAPSSRPSEERIEAVVSKLYGSIKVIARCGCPVHPKRILCHCSAGMSMLMSAEIHTKKKQDFVRLWDDQLLMPSGNAFHFNGDQHSHELFLFARGKTPRNFTEAFIDSEAQLKFFRPSGTREELVETMLDYWVTRTAQWKAVYGTCRNAGRWLEDRYDMSDMREAKRGPLLRRRLDGRCGGTAIEGLISSYGPTGHRCSGRLIPYDDFDGNGGFAIILTAFKLCHVPCPVSDPLRLPSLRASVHEIGRHYGRDLGYDKMDWNEQTHELTLKGGED